MGIAPFLLAGALLQSPATTPPFELELPEDYLSFVRVDAADGESWVSLRKDESAQFELRHFLLATPGARADLVAVNLRTERWEPLMRGFGSEIKPWEGKWAGLKSAGHRIDYVYQDLSKVILQRLVVEDDHLVIGTWEGERIALAAATTALESFKLPASWRAKQVSSFDEELGLGSTATIPPALGHFEVEVDATDASWAEIGVRVQFRPLQANDPEKPEWLLPPNAILDHSSATEVRYRISMVNTDGLPVPQAGLTPGPGCLAAFGPGWIAMPGWLSTADGRFAAPEVTLSVIRPAHLTALSDVAIDTVWAVQGNADGVFHGTRFVTRTGGGSWPIFALGFYEDQVIGERLLRLRRSAESPTPERAIRALDDLTRTATQIWPAANPAWTVLTFPGAGDGVFPELIVFDEANRWLRDPVDGEWIDGNRRAGLARKLGFLWFGRQVAGRGHGAVFLDASLSEYAAWRLLESAGATREAKAMRQFWIDTEQAASSLPRPLSLMPLEDLTGARRLMTRGALVWKAIEDRAGRAALDRILNQRLQRGGSWTTEDLRNALEAGTEREWTDWFRQHVYGRARP
jgi:hypothetical protein